MRTRAPSIVVPMVLLVIGTAIFIVAVQFAVMFRGPPPGLAPVPLTRVAETLRTGKQPAGMRPNWLQVRHVTGDALELPYDRSSPARDAAIAARIPVPADQVRGSYQWPTHDPEQDVFGSFAVALRTSNGWTVVSGGPRPTLTRWHLMALGAMLGTLLVLSLVAWLFARRISRPIRQLADAAKRARLGSPVTIPVAGPREIRELSSAIESMQTRILQQAENRTVMLAAMAHDIGTPLSRLAFWIEQLPDAARERAASDIDEMRRMLSATLRFTRDDRTPMAPVMLDLGSVIESLADDLAATDQPVSVAPGPRIVIRADPNAMRGLFSNLIENAIRYGERARVSWQAKGGWAIVDVDDDGPGFDPATCDRLFAPFVRGESSRNRATGGTGLGLAIVRGLVDVHEGEIALLTRDTRGGRVRVRLPLAT